MGSSLVGAAEKRPIDIIEDNSFLIEEAYNQEPGVVQHIVTAAYNNDSRRRGWSFSFTQEWPVFSQDHQFSYTVPSYHFIDGTDRIYVGDILLNYRYQALEEGDIPTGNRDRGTGDGVVGYQWNLPFSKKLASRFAMHANFGLTYLPGVRTRLGGSTAPLSPKHSLVSYNLGASGIFALFPRLHLMLEWAGTFEEPSTTLADRRATLPPSSRPGFARLSWTRKNYKLSWARRCRSDLAVKLTTTERFSILRSSMIFSSLPNCDVSTEVNDERHY